MIILFPFLIAALAAILNRFRGGGLFMFPWETEANKSTQIRRVTYALFIGLVAWNPFVGLAVFLTLLTGWGYPISVAIKKKHSPIEPEFEPFDKISAWMTGKTNVHAYGVVWLTLHGFISGTAVALLMGSFWPVLWACMGLCYKFAGDWERGELFDGTVKGFTLALAIITAM